MRHDCMHHRVIDFFFLGGGALARFLNLLSAAREP